MRNEKVLQVENLSICYGSHPVVKDVSFSIGSGEILGLLGPNGAGKTSILSAIEGLVKPASGAITVANYNIGKQPLQARANMGVQLQSTSFQPELSIREILYLYSGLYGVKITKEEINTAMLQMKLEDAASKKYTQLSGGQQQRVSLCIATIHNPSLVMLDEPTTGLDPQSRRHLWEHIETMRQKGHAILLTTHSMEEAEAVCDRVAILHTGKIIDIDLPKNLIAKYDENADVIKASRKGKITLEDVFIGLTGATLCS